MGRKKTQKVTRGSHRNDVSPLTQGLRYRAACDKRNQFVDTQNISRPTFICGTIPSSLLGDEGATVVVVTDVLVHLTDTSVVDRWYMQRELYLPKSLWKQSPIEVSVPLQCRRSSQIGPVPAPYLAPIYCPVNLTTTRTDQLFTAVCSLN